jgi:two-component system, sensor histidine kinase PdtaS
MRWSFEQADPITVTERKIKHVIGRSDIRLRKDDPITHQEVLLREMQHRVANSLQIVAGILSLKARTVKSDDARSHLLDACDRVMAVAAVQRQLLDSKQASMIRIDDYLSELSQRLAQSLTDNVSLSLVVDGIAVMESNKAVAIGLIATELIINALKHAFPRNRPGKIFITYKTNGSDWSLSVSDNGVGLTNGFTDARHSGYGTRIIDALTQQLDARVEVKSGSKGARVGDAFGCVHRASQI